jgi:hypothetical protein
LDEFHVCLSRPYFTSGTRSLFGDISRRLSPGVFLLQVRQHGREVVIGELLPTKRDPCAPAPKKERHWYPHSSSHGVLRGGADKYILRGASKADNPLTSDSSTTVLDTVAHTPGGISYVTATLVNPTVKAIGLDGINATEQNVK